MLKWHGGFSPTRRRTMLKWHGGLGLTKPKDIADNALVYTWLADKVPALRYIALRARPQPAEPTGSRTRGVRRRHAEAQPAADAIPNDDLPEENGPLHGFAERSFRRVWERPRIRGGKTILPHRDPSPLPPPLSLAKTSRSCNSGTSSPDANGGINRTDIATHVTSLNGPLTMASASIAPVRPSFRLRADIFSHLVHYLLNLPNPDFIDLKHGTLLHARAPHPRLEVHLLPHPPDGGRKLRRKPHEDA